MITVNDRAAINRLYEQTFGRFKELTETHGLAANQIQIDQIIDGFFKPPRLPLIKKSADRITNGKFGVKTTSAYFGFNEEQLELIGFGEDGPQKVQLKTSYQNEDEINPLLDELRFLERQLNDKVEQIRLDNMSYLNPDDQGSTSNTIEPKKKESALAQKLKAKLSGVIENKVEKEKEKMEFQYLEGLDNELQIKSKYRMQQTQLVALREKIKFTYHKRVVYVQLSEIEQVLDNIKEQRAHLKGFIEELKKRKEMKKAAAIKAPKGKKPPAPAFTKQNTV